MKKVNPLFILLGLGALWYFTKGQSSDTPSEPTDEPSGGKGGPGGGASDVPGPIPSENLPVYSGEGGIINPADILQF